MAELVVSVNNRRYPIRCADGEEPHVLALSEDLDRRVAAIRQSVGPIDDARLLLMAALVIADELAECRGSREQPARSHGAAQAEDGDLIATLSELARRIEAVAARLQAS